MSSIPKESPVPACFAPVRCAPFPGPFQAQRTLVAVFRCLCMSRSIIADNTGNILTQGSQGRGRLGNMGMYQPQRILGLERRMPAEQVVKCSQV